MARNRKKKEMSFLIINSFGIGDVMFSTPLLRNLKENFPGAKIFYVCSRRTEPLLRNNPLVSGTFVYEWSDFERLKQRSKVLWIKAILRLLKDIKKERISVCLDLSLNSQFSFFAWLIGIKRRLGLDYKKRGIFLTDKLKITGFEHKHVVEYYLDLLKLLNVPVKKFPMEIYCGREADDWGGRVLDKLNLSAGRRIIGISPCGGDTWGPKAFLKRWPENNFSELINRVAEKYSAAIFIFSGPNEKKEVNRILSGVRDKSSCHVFTDCSLERVVGLLRRCSLVISNDTGILRFADALGKDLIALFGPVDEKVYGPYPPGRPGKVVLKKDIACRPCYRRFRLSECVNDQACLKGIDVEEVLETIEAIFRKRERV